MSILTESNANLGSYGEVCSAIDRDENLSGASISYITSDTALPIRASDRTIENHVIITPVGDGRPTGSELSKRLVDVGVDCGLASLAYVSSVAACGGTVVTLGTTAPLCALGLVSSSASTWSCATSIGKFVNEIQDPNFNKAIEQDGSWFKKTNDIIEQVGLVADIVSLSASIKQLHALRNVAKQHGNKIGATYTKKESIQAVKEMADATYEAFTYEKVLRAINEQGAKVRFSPKVLTSSMDEIITRGMSNQATKKFINQRGLSRNFSVAEQGGAIARDILATAASRSANAVKEVGHNLAEKAAEQSAQNRNPRHVMHIFQQARP